MSENHIRNVGEEFDMLTDDEKWHYAICADWWVYDESNPFIHYPLTLTNSQKNLYEKCLQWAKDHHKLLLLKHKK